MKPTRNDFGWPMVSQKLEKLIFKLIKKAEMHRGRRRRCIRRGFTAVRDLVRRRAYGLVVIAGNVRDEKLLIDLPYECSEEVTPFCYISSVKKLRSKFNSNVIMIPYESEYGNDFVEILSQRSTLLYPQGQSFLF